MLTKQKHRQRMGEGSSECQGGLSYQRYQEQWEHHDRFTKLSKEIQFLKGELERKSQQLRDTQRVLSEVHERMSDAYYELDAQWRFVDVNQTFCGFVKKEKEEILGKLCWESLPKGIAQELYTHFSRSLTYQEPIQFEAFCEFTGKALLFKVFPEKERLYVYLSDLTEQRKAEMGLSESKAKNHLILESITDAFFAVDHNWKLIDLNHVAEEIYQFKRQEVINRDFWDLFSRTIGTEFHAKCYQAVEKQIPLRLEAYSSYASGLLIEANLFPSPEGLYIFFRDITEKRRIEKEILRLNNLHLIGELSAGISHEVRNPMTTVRGFLQILGQKKEYAKDKEFFNLMIGELDRTNSIITEFLSLAKGKLVKLEDADLNEKIEVLYPLLLTDALKSEKNIQLNLGRIPLVRIDENEIRQLLLNLVRNGFEAMPPGGTVTISTFAEADEVILAVADEGHGIPTQIMDKIGTPFYTTKDRGTGLGLAICYSIANRHQALLDVKSSPQGTQVIVKFKKVS